jgi:hypothetical protein
MSVFLFIKVIVEHGGFKIYALFTHNFKVAHIAGKRNRPERSASSRAAGLLVRALIVMGFPVLMEV